MLIPVSLFALIIILIVYAIKQRNHQSPARPAGTGQRALNVVGMLLVVGLILFAGLILLIALVIHGGCGLCNIG